MRAVREMYDFGADWEVCSASAQVINDFHVKILLN